MTRNELVLIYDNLAHVNRDEWERLRLQTYLLKQNGYIKKNVDIKKFMPFEWEQFKGSTKADPKMIEWWENMKKKKENN